MLPPDVERRREHASLLPFERVFASAFVPDAGLAFASEHVDCFFEQVTLGLRALARIEIEDISAVGPFGAGQINERAACSHALPRFHLEPANIRDKITGVNR